MRLPIIQGIIRRRILLNFRVDPVVMQRQLPSKFRPKLYKAHAIAGICLIRLEKIRPKFVPFLFGLSSENAAHRIAICWENEGMAKEGVFIPRRDTDSILNHLVGGRLFPGEHHQSIFQVNESEERIELNMTTYDSTVSIKACGKIATSLRSGSCFSNLSEASDFFEPGSLGYSVTKEQGRLDGIILKTKNWKVEPLEIETVYSSYFSDLTIFPKGSIKFDCALLMRNLEHEWHGAPDLYV